MTTKVIGHSQSYTLQTYFLRHIFKLLLSNLLTKKHTKSRTHSALQHRNRTHLKHLDLKAKCVDHNKDI